MIIDGPDGGAWMASMRTPCGEGSFMVSSADGFLGDNAGHLFLFANLPEDSDIDRVYADSRSIGAEIVGEIRTEWAGIRAFEFKDPDGHTWRVAKRVAPFDLANLPPGCKVRSLATV